MEPDTKNMWMTAELGPYPPDSQTRLGGGRGGTPAASPPHEVAFFFTRLVFGLLFACHGLQKLFGIFGGQPMTHDPWMLSAGTLELAGGVAIALGFFARPVAFLLCGEMAVAYFKMHFPAGFWPILNHGELAVLYCFFFLYVSRQGAGAISIDGLRGKG